MDYSAYLWNVFLGGSLSTTILLALHIALWDRPWRLTPPATYVVGVFVLLVGCGVWGLQQSEEGPIDPIMAVLAFGIIATMGGLSIGIAYWARGRLKLIEEGGRQKRVLDRELGSIIDGTPSDPRRN
jgi:hypothetical protein